MTLDSLIQRSLGCMFHGTWHSCLASTFVNEK